MNLAKSFVLGVFSVCCASPAFAYLSIAESGEILPVGKYQVGLEPQVLLNRGGGANLNVFLDTAFSDSTSGRITMGAGSVDFNAFASVKWMPFPDVDNQPAMGIRIGAGVARDEDENIVQIQAAPMASKRFNTEYGMTVPYIAIPFTYLNMDSDNVWASNLAIGSEWHPTDWAYGTIGGEVGFEINKSYSYISVFATFPFDDQKGFGK
jgi:hypothetical protein